jgi:hypothetical protein
MESVPLGTVSSAFRGRNWKRVALRGSITLAIALYACASITQLLSNSAFSPISPAFAKKNGNGNNGNGNGNGNGAKSVGGNGGGNGNGAGGNGGGAEGEAESGGNASGGSAGVNDFHDEGFATRKHEDIRIRHDKDQDLDDRMRKDKLDDGLGFKDKLDLNVLKGNFHNNFGVTPVDPKILKNELGNVEEYIRPAERGGAFTSENSSAGTSRLREKLAAPGSDKEKIKEYINILDTGASNAAGVVSEGGRRVEENGAVADAETASKKGKPALEGEVDTKAELKEALAGLKQERKDATTKEEKKALKAEMKRLKDEQKEAKKADKADKGVNSGELSAEQAVTRNGSGGANVEPVRVGTYASREVLALGLSPVGDERVRALGFQVSNSALEYGGTTLKTLIVPERMDALGALRLLRRELSSDSFHLNRIYRPYIPSKDDTFQKEQQPELGPGGRNCLGDKCYSKTVIHWNDNLAKCSRDISIGVIDTDIDLKHPTFAGRNIVQRSFLAEGKKASPNWHGTGILALLAGRPDSSTPGLVPEAKFVVANSFFADADGEAITDTVSLLRSLEWMATSGVKVVNMSFAGPDDVLVQGRLKTLRSGGLVFTAAAGNDGPVASPNYPAAYPEVVAVTAVTKDLRIYPSANRGPYIDLAAPGVRIWTALPDGREGYRTGTSFATPFATAVLALQHPDMMSGSEETLLDNLRTVPLGTGERNPIYGRGLLQAPSECPGSGATASSKTAPPPR